MTKIEQKRYDRMESALRVIHTWANYFLESYDTIGQVNHREKLKAIADKCLRALGKEE